MISQLRVALFVLLFCDSDAADRVKRQDGDFVFPDYDYDEMPRPWLHPMPPPRSNQVGQLPVVQPTVVPMMGVPVTVDSSTTPFPPNLFACLQNCPTTSEYNPICGSNRQLYFNEQKFNCARKCGTKVDIARRGNCAGLFQMTRG